MVEIEQLRKDLAGETDRAMIAESNCDALEAANAKLKAALAPFANLGIGSGPDHHQDTYKIEYGAIRAARAALGANG